MNAPNQQPLSGTPPVSVATLSPGGVPEEVSGLVLAILAAAVAVTFGKAARILHATTSPSVAPSWEIDLQQWSIEGRRQIYSSHKIR